jgi:hypothetical protein
MGFWFWMPRLKPEATTRAKTSNAKCENTGVLRYAQNDNVKQTTAGTDSQVAGG